MAGTPTLTRMKDWFKDIISESEIVQLRKVLRKVSTDRQASDAMDIADRILGGYGVEAIRGEAAPGGYFPDIVALYVNMGDTYTSTLIYDTVIERFLCSTMGGFVESRERRYGIY